jgi:hypothetical protein
VTRKCDSCHQPYEAKRAASRYCSATCRVRANRNGQAKKNNPPVAIVKSRRTSVEAATLAELEAAGRVESAAGQQALALAALIDDPQGAFSAVAGWAREHRAALAEALRTDQVVQSTSLADQLKARRDARRGA